MAPVRAQGATPAQPMLSAAGVAVELSGRRILEGAELELRRGELIAMVGPNGAGKSTFVRALAGLQKLAAGSVHCMGRELSSISHRRLARMRAFVPQRPRVPDGVTVIEAVTIGRSAQLRALQPAGRRDREAAEQALARAGAEQFAERRLTTLSGGELQRVQIAVGLAQDAPVLIADEPTSHLDLGATVSVARLLRGLADDGLAVVLVVHDLALAAAVADSVVVMSGGRSVAAGSPAEVLDRVRLAEVWGVRAELDAGAGDGHTGLRVSWLAEPEPAPGGGHG
jgi:iron complex transport system ATP-binding protein